MRPVGPNAGRMESMSNAAQLNTGGLPKGELLGRYRTYDDAQRVVDHLAAAEDFDIKTLTIVGNDLRSVEHIRSRLSYPGWQEPVRLRVRCSASSSVC